MTAHGGRHASNPRRSASRSKSSGSQAPNQLIAQRDVEPLDNPYYGGLRFQLWMRLGAADLPISDGGLFDWMQTLCSDRKEQLVTSAMGVELAVRLRP